MPLTVKRRRGMIVEVTSDSGLTDIKAIAVQFAAGWWTVALPCQNACLLVAIDVVVDQEFVQRRFPYPLTEAVAREIAEAVAAAVPNSRR